MKLKFGDVAFRGRLLAIIVLTAVSGGSFALGYMVGTITTPVEPERAFVEPLEEGPTVSEERFAMVEESLPPIDLPEVIEETPARPEAAPPREPEKAPEETRHTKKRAVKKPSGETYSVQAGLFQERSYAEALAEKLRGKGYSAYIEDSGDAYKVKVGRFPTRDGAETLAAKLKDAEGIEGFVTGPR
jgi:cell division septation protein DedD